MADNLEPVFIEESKISSNKSINVEKVLSKIVAYWPLFLICIIVSIVVAYVYLRYSTPKYNAHAKVLIKDDQKGGGMGEGQMLQELGIQTSAANVENEVEIFRSRTLMKKVVGDRELNFHYYAPGRIKTSEYHYTDLPFRIIPLFDNHDVGARYKYDIELKGDGFVLRDKENTWNSSWGDTLNLPVGRVVIADRRAMANPAYDLDFCNIEIKPTEYQAIRTLRKLDVEPVSNKASIIELTVTDELPQRAEDILDGLVAAYMQANIDDRNTTLDETVDFIDARLQEVSGELTGVEENIEQFKSTNKLTDLSEQSKMLLNYNSEYAKQLTEKEVKLRVLESIEKYLDNPANTGRIVPSTLLVEDDAALGAINRYNELQLRRSALLLSSTEDNPYVKNIDRQLEDIRADLRRSLASVKQSTKISITELDQKAGSIEDRIRKVPEHERKYLEYSRQQNIKQELYLYLLKKREETAISKSSTVANARVVDPAKSDGAPFSPKRNRVYLAAIAIGLMIPGSWLFIKELLSVRVTSKDDVKQNTTINIIGELVQSDTSEQVVVQRESKTIIAEQFRALRTNMQFLLGDQDRKVVLLTSSMSGEGKSFAALNLSVTLALSGEKVVLLELDLRKPKISANLNLQSSPGFTKYVIGQAALKDIILPSGVMNNLSVIPSGAVPPNPSELMMSHRVKEMFDALKAEYDYVIVDSAPVGLVTDAQILGRHSDVVLYIARMNYTYKEQLRNAEELHRTGKMRHMHLLLNGVKRTGTAYGYGYGSYGSNYFEDNNKGIVNRLKNIKKR